MRRFGVRIVYFVRTLLRVRAKKTSRYLLYISRLSVVCAEFVQQREGPWSLSPEIN